MKEFRLVLGGVALLLTAVLGTCAGQAIGAARAERADSLRVLAVTELALAQQEARQALRTVAALTQRVDSLRLARHVAAARGTVALATLPPVPSTTPDTCAPWAARAVQAETAARDLREANRLADSTIVVLQQGLDTARAALTALQRTTAQQVPVLVHQSAPRRGFSWNRLLPEVSVGYGVVFPPGSPVAHGPALVLGYRIPLGRIL